MALEIGWGTWFSARRKPSQTCSSGRSSKRKEYFTWAFPLAQSSDPPEAGSKRLSLEGTLSKGGDSKRIKLTESIGSCPHSVVRAVESSQSLGSVEGRRPLEWRLFPVILPRSPSRSNRWNMSGPGGRMGTSISGSRSGRS